MPCVGSDGLQKVNVMLADDAVAGFPKFFPGGFYFFVIYGIDVLHRYGFALAKFVYQPGGGNAARVAQNAG